VRLIFSVLWFDDSEDYFDSLNLEPLEQEVLSWGFFPNFKLVTTPEEFYSSSPFTFLDLIVVDRNLEEYEDGQEFIAKLRANAIYTEVIFYTVGNTSELWDAIHEKQLEGVFVSHRSDILTKISRIGRQSIQKVLDLENMRGIVMAEVGELDHLLDEIIIIGIASLSAEQQVSIFKRFYEGAVTQNLEDKNHLEAFSKKPEIENMLSLCDSNKRWQNFNRLWRNHDKLKRRQRIGKYDRDVLNPRNFLAHGKPELQEDGGYIFIHRGREFRFNDDTSLVLRQTILKYKKAFSEILETLKNEQ
jgi:hypothetical protein